MTGRKPPRKKAREPGAPVVPRAFRGKLLDVAGAAELIGTTAKTIRAEVARGLLPYRRLGARIVFRREELEDFLARLPGVNVDQAIANAAARGAR